MCFCVCFLSFILTTILAQEFQVAKGKSSFSIRFKHVGSLAIIPLSINGSEPLNFVLDTGSPYTIITNLDAINHFELKKGSPVKISGLGRDLTKIDAYLSKANSIKIGKAESQKTDIVLIFNDSFDLSTRFGLPIYGIIGYDILKDFVAEIDYSKEKITFYQPEYFYTKKNLSKFEKLDLELKNKKPYIQIKSNFNDQMIPLNLLIDTGSWEAFWLFEDPEKNILIPENSIEDYLGFGLNGEIHGKRTRLNFVEMGNYRIDKPTTSFPDSLSIAAVNRKERNGTIGSEILQRFTTIYDYKNKAFYFKKNSKFGKPFHYNLAGLELYQPYPELPYLEVSYVRKGSPADLAGLKKGDAIRLINNKKIGVFNSSIYEDKFSALKSDFIEVSTKKREIITLPEIIDLFKTKEGEKITVVYTRGQETFERRTSFKLEKSI